MPSTHPGFSEVTPTELHLPSRGRAVFRVPILRAHLGGSREGWSVRATTEAPACQP